MKYNSIYSDIVVHFDNIFIEAYNYSVNTAFRCVFKVWFLKLKAFSKFVNITKERYKYIVLLNLLDKCFHKLRHKAWFPKMFFLLQDSAPALLYDHCRMFNNRRVTMFLSCLSYLSNFICQFECFEHSYFIL